MSGCFARVLRPWPTEGDISSPHGGVGKDLSSDNLEEGAAVPSSAMRGRAPLLTPKQERVVEGVDGLLNEALEQVIIK